MLRAISTLAVSTCCIAGPVLADAPVELSAADGAPVVETIVVTGYDEGAARSASKTDVPLLETPQAIRVIPREWLDDQAALKLEDALRNVAGVMPGGYYSNYDYFRIRGFDASGFTYLDGLAISRGIVILNRELEGLEQIEVVKGPASTLYGAGSLGGLVNLVSKRPRQENFVDAEMTAGSNGYYQPVIDAGAVLNADRSVYGRVELLYRNDDTFVEHSNQKRLYLAPALTWNLSDATTITMLSSYQDDDGRIGFPLPAVGTIVDNPNGKIPLDRFTGEPGRSNRIEESVTSLGYQFTHRFDDSWSIRQNLRNTHDQYQWTNVLYTIGFTDDSLRSIGRLPYDYRGDSDTLAADTSLLGEFAVGGVRHTLLLGVDYYGSKDQNHGGYTSFDSDALALDLFTPDYGVALAGRPDDLAASRSDLHQTGLYIQDQAKLGQRITVTIGVRSDQASINSYGSRSTAHKASPRAGLTYEITGGLAAYANYSESFLPQSGVLADAAGHPITDAAKPETGDNREVGLKGDLYDHRLTFTAAIYQLTRANVLTPIAPNAYVFHQSGESRSRGFELDATLRPITGWELTAAYAYTDAEVTHSDLADAIGKPLQNVPRNSLSLWTRYTVQAGVLRGLGVGVGGSHYSKQAGCQAETDCSMPTLSDGSRPYGTTFNLPSYTLLNAALYYRVGPLRAQLNVKNLLDEDYYTGSYNAYYVQPGSSRTVLMSLAYNW